MYDMWHVFRSFKQTLLRIMLRFPEAETPLLIILVQSTSRVHGKSMSCRRANDGDVLEFVAAPDSLIVQISFAALGPGAVSTLLVF